jgi:hypothetical protein
MQRTLRTHVARAPAAPLLNAANRARRLTRARSFGAIAAFQSAYACVRLHARHTANFANFRAGEIRRVTANIREDSRLRVNQSPLLRHSQ